MRERRTVFYSYEAAGPDPLRDLSAEQRGNLTPAHRQLLAEPAPGPGSTWSESALWACLDQLRTGTSTQTPEVRVEHAWTDGPETFCVIYTVTFDPDLRLGIRLHRDDADSDDLGSTDPTWFGGDIADFSIGEPLGSVFNNLRIDEHGVSWWGDLDAELPITPRFTVL